MKIGETDWMEKKKKGRKQRGQKGVVMYLSRRMTPFWIRTSGVKVGKPEEKNPEPQKCPLGPFLNYDWGQTYESKKERKG